MKKFYYGLSLVFLGVCVGGVLVYFLSSPRVTITSDPLNFASDSIQLGRKDYYPEQIPDVSNLNKIFRNVAKEIKPSVVYITVLSDELLPVPKDGNHSDFWKYWSPQQFQQNSAGSGVILNQDGYIVTNNHVVDGATQIRVMLDDRREYPAELVGTDPSTDIAVIKIPSSQDLPVAPLGNSENVEVGDWVMAIGSPFRLTQTVTAGIVSAMGRQIDIIDDQFRIEDFIQTDAAINPGNSGGALVNMSGQLIGISTAIATESGSYEGYGFAVPVNLMERVVKDLIVFGEVKRGYLGIAIQTLSAEQAKILGLEKVEGVLVQEVYPNSAAFNAGLQRGDVLLAIDNFPVNASNELQRLVALRKPGQTISLSVWRDERLLQMSAALKGLVNAPKLSDALQNTPEPVEPPRELPDEELSFEDSLFDSWGIEVRPLERQEYKTFGVRSGVFLDEVKKSNLSTRINIPSNSIILSVEGEKISSVEDLVASLQKKDRGDYYALLEIKKANGRIGFYELERLD